LGAAAVRQPGCRQAEGVIPAGPNSRDLVPSERSLLMSNLIAVIFEDEAKAVAASQLLHELDTQGSIGVSAMAVMTKDAAGKISARPLSDLAGGATLGGAFIGALAGLVGGLSGAALGAATGALVGGSADAINREDRRKLIEKASHDMNPESAALLAEITEFSDGALEAQMASLGGRVVRG
jgi:uncharacterized membrane protein